MAGGKGTRLREITSDNYPKPLVLLNKRPLLDHIIDHVKKNGCDNVIVCVGYLGEMIKKHIESIDYGIPVTVSLEKKPLGSAGALHLIKDKLEDEFFILYGDVYTTINLKKMYMFFKKSSADAVLALHTSDHPQDSTVVTIDENKKIGSLIEKPGKSWEKYGNLTTTPLYILKKDVIHFIEENKVVDFAKDVFPKMLVTKKNLFGYSTDEYAKDIGTPERYNKVLQLLKK